MMKNNNQERQVALNLANTSLLAQLDSAHKAVMACARYGLTVIGLRFNGAMPTLEVQYNLITQKWLDNHKAIIYMHSNNANNRMISTAQRRLCGCRVIFSFPRYQPTQFIH
ncbi:hypothetical protein A6B39_10585 [Mannheimia granulomatis]|uniref:hypothetical protein n=1 Tax=Mannheimia granulomatis TaxID=85402 RepID=UPI00159D056E|nr:hypothetical protein [Mannheimia granulomatis]QLB15862.1 hypothetical protein A6B39_10585 [Mannheimia granulomatis]